MSFVQPSSGGTHLLRDVLRNRVLEGDRGIVAACLKDPVSSAVSRRICEGAKGWELIDHELPGNLLEQLPVKIALRLPSGVSTPDDEECQGELRNTTLWRYGDAAGTLHIT